MERLIPVLPQLVANSANAANVVANAAVPSVEDMKTCPYIKPLYIKQQGSSLFDHVSHADASIIHEKRPRPTFLPALTIVAAQPSCKGSKETCLVAICSLLVPLTFTTIAVIITRGDVATVAKQTHRWVTAWLRTLLRRCSVVKRI